MTFKRIPGVPRVVVCTQARSGSSMLMEMLQAGGLVVDHDDDNSPQKLEFLRNPHGVFEIKDLVATPFFNSIKLFIPTWMARIAPDYKLIYLKRDPARIVASRLMVIKKFRESGLRIHWKRRKKVHRRLIGWAEALKGRKYLEMDYDAICSNPLAAANILGKYLDTPKFTFDREAAAAVVNLKLYTKSNQIYESKVARRATPDKAPDGM